MVAAGYDLPYIQAQVGHRDPSTTLAIYARVIARPDRDQLRRRPGGRTNRRRGRRTDRPCGTERGPSQSHLHRKGRKRPHAPPMTTNRQSSIEQKSAICRTFSDGETRTRTGDTTVFSRVLYQLSYLALRGDAIGWRETWIASGVGKARRTRTPRRSFRRCWPRSGTSPGRLPRPHAR